MSSFEFIIILMISIILIKVATNLFTKVTNFRRDEFKYSVNVTKDNINHLSDYEFKGFCKWLLESTDDYSSIVFYESDQEDDKDIILTTSNNEKIYVECKRLNLSDCDDSDLDEEDLQIGRAVCQKLVGSMISDNIKKGIIITTGTIHPNARKYIEKLQENSNISLEILTTPKIIEMLQRTDKTYSLEVTI